MRPVLPVFHQTRPYRVLEDVIRPLAHIFLPPQPMIKKIPLPFHPQMTGGPMLPVLHRWGEFSIRWEPGQHRNMIRHDHRQMHPPFSPVMIETNGFQQSRCSTPQGSRRPISGTEREEKDLPRWIDCPRRLVRQTFASDFLHLPEDRKNIPRCPQFSPIQGRDGAPPPSDISRWKQRTPAERRPSRHFSRLLLAEKRCAGDTFATTF